MEIRLLKEEYIFGDSVYQDFISNTISGDLSILSNNIVTLDNIVVFPIYMNNKKNEKEKDFLEAFHAIKDHYINLDRDILFDPIFWYTLLLTTFRDSILQKHPKIYKNKNIFYNVVLKKFDWENYIYKCLLAVQYIVDNIDELHHEKYFHLVMNNLDIFNYMIKYRVFRNDRFIISVLSIIDENDLSETLKAKITGIPKLGKDERYGRRVIFELNKRYPVVLSPMMNQSELSTTFMNCLNKYRVK